MESVANVRGETIGDTERDVDGSAKDEHGHLVQTRAVVRLEL